MRNSTNVNTKGSDSLFYISSSICTLYIVLRVILAGSTMYAPQTVFVDSIALVAFTTAVISRLLSNGLIIPSRGLLIALFLAVIGVIISVLNTNVIGYLYPSLILSRNLLSDIFIFIAVVLTARERMIFRVYISLFGAMVGVVGFYALYQKLYALEYLRDITMNSIAFRESISSKGEVLLQAFIKKIENSWVGGSFSEPSFLCAFSLLTILIIYGVRSKRPYRLKFNVILLLSIIGVVFSGSIFGIFLCKIFEIVLLYKFVNSKNTFLKDALLVIGGVGIMSIISLVLLLGLFIAVGSTLGLIIYCVLWYVEFEVLKNRYINNENKPGEHLIGAGVLTLFILISLILIISPIGSELGYFREFIVLKLREFFLSSYAAFSAFIDAPFLGWGLDNFSDVHSIYKSSVAVEMGRASNIYFELLADGGFLLFGVMLFLISVIIFRGSVERRTHREVGIEKKSFYKTGSKIIIAGFILSYVFVYFGLFDHAGVNYFLYEIKGSPGSFIGRGLSATPLVIHFLVNFILLPLVGLYCFNKIWCFSNDLDYIFFEDILKLSLIVFLLFGVCIDFLYIPALGGLFCVVAGMLVSRQRSWGMLNISKKMRSVLIYSIIIASLLWGVWGLWDGIVASIFEKVAFSYIKVYKNVDEIQKGIEAFDSALVYSDKNADLYIERANLIMQLYELNPENVSKKELNRVVLDVNKAIKLRPYESNYLIILAKILNVINISENKDKINSLYKLALSIYPTNSRYPYLYAKFLINSGDLQGAKREAARAIKLNAIYDLDPTTRLKSFELYKARGIVNGMIDQ